MTTVSSEITNLQNQTAFAQVASSKNTTATTNSANDSNMFLTLMLKQLENQDPTEPTDNTQWLSQLAQYSSLEQMTQMNEGLSKCMNYMSSMYNDMSLNSEITQTLSLETRHAARSRRMSILSGKCSPKCRVHLRMSNIAPYVFETFSNYKFKSQYL